MDKKTPDGMQKDIEKIKKEKQALIEKNKSLADIIEEITKERDDDKEDKRGPSKVDIEDEVSSAVKKGIETELSGLDDKLKDLDKIADMAKKVQELSEQVKNAPQAQAPQGGVPTPENQAPGATNNPNAAAASSNPFGGPTPGTGIAQNIVAQAPVMAGPVGKALASFGEDVDFQTELIGIKNTITDTNKTLNNLQKKMEYRVSRLEDGIKAIDRISELEQGFDEISEKLSPENVQKLKRLIFSTDELVDEIIPELINKRLRTRVDPILSDMGNVKNSMEVLNNRLVGIRNDIKGIQKFENEVNEIGMDLKLERERVNKKIDGCEDNNLESLENLREETRKKLERITDDISKIQTKSNQLIAEVVKEIFMDIVDPKISDIERGDIVFDERLKKLFDSIEKVKRQMQKLQAPENLKEWIDDKGSDIEKKLQMEIVSVLKDKLSVIEKIKKEVTKNDEEIILIKKELMLVETLHKDSTKHGESITELKDRTRKLEIDTKDIPKQLDYHSKQINRLSDTKEIFGRDIEKLFGQGKALEERATKDEKDISSIFSELKATEKSVDSRFDGVTNNIVTLGDNLRNLDNFVNNFASDTGKLETVLKEDIRTTRTELSSMLNRKIESTKKDLERVRDRDLADQLKSFNNEIKKISEIENDFDKFRNSQETLNNRLTKDISELRSVPSDIKFLRESVSSLKDTNILLDKRLGSEIPKAMSSLVNSKFQEVTEDFTSELNNQIEFSQALAKNLAQAENTLNQNMNGLRTEITTDIDNTLTSLKQDMEKKFSQNAENDLRRFDSEIRRIGSMEQSLVALRKSYESFSSKVEDDLGALQASPQDIQILKKKIKELETIDKDLDKRLNSLKAPENMKKWFDNKVEDFHDDLLRDIKSLEDQLAKQSDVQADLKDTVLTLTNISRNMPAKLEKQQNQINRILDSRESLSNHSEALQATLKQLSIDLANERDRLASVEKTIGKAHEPRLDRLSGNMVSLQQEVAGIQGFANDLAKNLSSSSGKLRDTFTKAESKMAMRFDSTISNLRDELARARDKDFKNQIEKFRQEMDRVASLEKGLMSLQQTDKESSRQQAERLSTLEKLMPEVKYLRDKVVSLEEDNKKLTEVVSKNQVQIVEAIDQKTTDSRKLEQNLQSQKAKMAKLLKELKK